MALQKLRLGKDANGNTTYTLPSTSSIIIHKTMAADTADSLVVPMGASIVFFSFSKGGGDVLVDLINPITGAPPSTFVPTTSFTNPVGRHDVAEGKTIYFYAIGTASIVSCEFFSGND